MTGRVKWFNEERGYGFIATEGRDIFVHYSGIIGDGHKALSVGDYVNFELSTQVDQKPCAINVEVLATSGYTVESYNCNGYNIQIPDDLTYQQQVASVLSTVREQLLSGVLQLSIEVKQRRIKK